MYVHIHIYIYTTLSDIPFNEVDLKNKTNDKPIVMNRVPMNKTEVKKLNGLNLFYLGIYE